MKFTNVVLIDDDRDDQELFIEATKEICSTIQCKTYFAAEIALQELTEKIDIPDAIFLDLNMPRMNGIEFLELIGKIPKLSETPIFVYSTTNYMEICRQRIQLVAAQCILKPDNYRDLINILRGIYTPL